MRYMSRVARWERKLGRTGQLAAGAGPESRSGLPHCGRHSAGARNDHDDDVSNHDDDHDDDDVRAIDDDHFDIHHGFNPMTVTELMVNRCDVNLVPEASRRPDSPPVGSDLGSAARSPAERVSIRPIGPVSRHVASLSSKSISHPGLAISAPKTSARWHNARSADTSVT